MGYKLQLNDSKVFLIDSPVEQTQVKWQGKDTNAIKFVLSDTSLTPESIKTTFTDATATAKITILFENGDFATEYANYSVLANITQSMADDKYSVTMAETSDLPSLISTLQSAVNALSKTVTDNKSAADKAVKEVGDTIDTMRISATKKDQEITKKFDNVDQNLSKLNAYLPSDTPIEEMPLADAKSTQIALCKMDLEDYLEANPITSSVHGGVPKQYAITSEKQAYLGQMITMATIAAQMSLEFTPSWNASGEQCTYDWTLAELTQLAFEIEARVRPLVTYQQTVESTIKEALSAPAVAAIEWDFSSVQSSAAVVVPTIPPVTESPDVDDTEPEEPIVDDTEGTDPVEDEVTEGTTEETVTEDQEPETV